MNHDEMRMQYLRKPAGHPHAELMAQYEQDVKDHGESAYKLWEYKANASIEWRHCVQTPEWAGHCKYRRNWLYTPTQQGHPHAALMAQYEQDVKDHGERAYTLWEFRIDKRYEWQSCVQDPQWAISQYRRKQQEHKHAQLMLQYAQDALTTDKPWELWEARDTRSHYPDNDWWYTLKSDPAWNTTHEYRRKPQTHTLVLNTEQLKEIIRACEYPDWENGDFVTGVAVIKAALKGAE
jgi:hypothetical protein